MKIARDLLTKKPPNDIISLHIFSRKTYRLGVGEVVRLRVRDLRLDDLAVMDDIGVDPGTQSGRINITFLSVSFTKKITKKYGLTLGLGAFFWTF